MNLILAIDIGTTNCKAVTFDVNGNVTGNIKGGYSILSDEWGKSEQNPEEVFAVVLSLLEKSFQKNQGITAVSFSAAMHSIIAIDKNDSPLTNAIIWADTRSQKQAARLKESKVGNTIYQKTGTPVHPMSPLCKIIWLRETQPDVFSQTSKFISLKEYVFLKLFGKYIIDDSIASATGLYDINEKKWCAEALNAAGISESHLSLPVDVTHFEKDILSSYKHLHQTDQPVSFVVGGNDGCLANLGSGVVGAGEACLTIGTSGALRMTTNNRQTDKQQRLFTYLLTKDIYVTGGAINNGGITLEWLSKVIMEDETPKEPDELLNIAMDAPAGAGGLLFLPYLLGERAPMWDAGAKGVLFGLSQQHTRAHIARAGVEGVCFAMRSVMQAMEEVDGPIHTIYASGGFTQSAFWLQMMADVLGKQIKIHNSADASATGAAIIGRLAMGDISGLEEATRFSKAENSYLPNKETHTLYNKMFGVFHRLYPKLKDEFAAINQL